MFGINVVLLVVASFTVIIAIIVQDPPLTGSEYKYSYDIKDPITGDTKSLQESRLSGVVKGSYSVIDPDGTRRTVEYTADAAHGFIAIVRTEPLTNNNELRNDANDGYFKYPYEYQNAEQNEHDIYTQHNTYTAVPEQYFY